MYLSFKPVHFCLKQLVAMSFEPFPSTFASYDDQTKPSLIFFHIVDTCSLKLPYHYKDGHRFAIMHASFIKRCSKLKMIKKQNNPLDTNHFRFPKVIDAGLDLFQYWNYMSITCVRATRLAAIECTPRSTALSFKDSCL